MTSDMRVFISFKTDPDIDMATELYDALFECGIPTFFSPRSIVKKAESNYKQYIDDCLDRADVLVLVASKPEYSLTSYVRYEWDSYHNDIISGHREARFISYLDNDDIQSFHRSIRSNQIFQRKDGGLEQLVEFIKNYISELEGVSQLH